MPLSCLPCFVLSSIPAYSAVKNFYFDQSGSFSSCPLSSQAPLLSPARKQQLLNNSVSGRVNDNTAMERYQQRKLNASGLTSVVPALVSADAATEVPFGVVAVDDGDGALMLQPLSLRLLPLLAFQPERLCAAIAITSWICGRPLLLLL